MKTTCALLFALCIGMFLTSCTAQQQFTVERNNAAQLFRAWHDVSCQEFLQNYEATYETIDTVLRLSSVMSPLTNRWYHGIAYYTRARAEVRLGKVQEAQQDILLALDSGYRNDALVRYDSVLTNKVGDRWLDSVVKEWVALQQEKKKRWLLHPMTIIEPTSGSAQDLVIGLHGGNGCYEEFSRHFLNLSDSLNYMSVFPAGPIRFSNVTHSWPAVTDGSDSAIMTAIDSCTRLHGSAFRSIYLIGYSQGAATAIGYALRHPQQIKGVMLFSGFTTEFISDSLVASAAKYGIRFFALSGKLDNPTFRESMTIFVKRCKQAGVLIEYEERDAMPHEVPLDAETVVADILKKMSSHSDLGAN